MTNEQLKTTARRFYDAINAGDFAAMQQIISPSFIENERSLPPGLPAGRDGVIALFTEMHRAMPDFHVEVEDILAEGDRIAARVVMTGTPQSSLMGIPANGKHVMVEVMDILRFDNNQLVEHWGVVDQIAMMIQLGVMPPMGG